jgi:FkbM family methyltransferase
MVSPLKNGKLVLDMLEKIKGQGWNLMPRDSMPAKAIVKYAGKGVTDVSGLDILDYQNNELGEALSRVENFDLAIDAGANYGFFTKHLDMFRNVHAFELYTPVRECLEKNVRDLGMTNTTVHACGLGHENKWVDIDPGRGTFSTHVDVNSDDKRYEIRTIDSFEFDSCDFIKIDCEGYETYILEGARETIERFAPVILMENKGYATERYGCVSPEQLLLDWGYEVLVRYKKDIIMGPVRNGDLLNVCREAE